MMLLSVLAWFALLWRVCVGSKVLQLSPGNFNSTLHSEPLLLVSFHAPWCAHCKKVSSELVEAAEDLVELSVSAKIAMVDVSLAGNAKIAEREQITGYPTMLVYKHGTRANEYFGGRTQRDIVQYLTQKSMPAIRHLSSLSDLAPYIDQFELGQLQEQGLFSIVVGAFVPSDGSDPTKGLHGKYGAMFNNTANHYDLALFFVTEDPAVLAQLHITVDSMVVFQEFPDETSTTFPFTEQSDEVSLMRYLLHEALPLTVPYSPETLSTISFHPVKSHVLVFSNTSNSDDGFVAMVDGIAQKYKSRLLFIEINPEEYHLASYFGLRKAILPQLVVVNMTDPDDLQRFYFADHLYAQQLQAQAQLQTETKQRLLQQRKAREAREGKLPATANEAFQSAVNPSSASDATGDEIHTAADLLAHDSMVHVANGVETALPYTAAHIDAFLQAYLQHALPRKLLSESPAEMEKLNEHSLNGYVENIAGSQFQHRIMDREWQNSFVYFHAPWCAHCKSLEPVMSEIGKHYLDDADFMLFRVDGIKNDIVHPRVRVNAYPSLFLFPAHNKGNPIEYDGERTVEALVDFIDSFKYTAPQSVAATAEVFSSASEEVSEGEVGADSERSAEEEDSEHVDTVAVDGDGKASRE